MTTNPTTVVPENSFLDLEDHLQLFNLVSSEFRFELIGRLVAEGETSISDLASEVERDESTVHYHLKKLVEAGLVRNRRQKRTGSKESYSHYEATALGKRLFTAITDFIVGDGSSESLSMDDSEMDHESSRESATVATSSDQPATDDGPTPDAPTPDALTLETPTAVTSTPGAQSHSAERSATAATDDSGEPSSAAVSAARTPCDQRVETHFAEHRRQHSILQKKREEQVTSAFRAQPGLEIVKPQSQSDR